MTKPIVALTVGLLVVAPSPVAAKDKPVRDCSLGKDMSNVPLVWRPTDHVTRKPVVVIMHNGGPPPPPIRIQVKPLVDARKDPSRIGENRQDVDQGCIYPVLTHADVAAWTSDRVRDLVGRRRFDVAENDSEVTLSGELRELFVTETGTYDTAVGFHFDLTSPEGDSLWSGIVFGRNTSSESAFKIERYYETISDALINAVDNLTDDPGFVRAVTAARNP